MPAYRPELIGSADARERETAFTLTAAIAATKLAEVGLDLQAGWTQRRMYERVRGSVMCMCVERSSLELTPIRTHEHALRRKTTGVRATPADRDLSQAVDEGEEQLAAANIGRLVNIMRSDSCASSLR